jgi:aspartate 4-decarboxylase
MEQKKNYNDMLHDLLLSTIGCFYPVPPQLQPHLNFISQDFMYNLVMGSSKGGNEEGHKLKPSDFEFFATEGAAAGILYVFNTLKENFFLKEGDTIAIITPIFSPYLEMPRLADYDLKIVELKGNPDNNYALDDEEINKLHDKKIRGLFMVNPSNPGAFSLPKENIDKIGKLINTKRPDLFVLSDSVYAPFARKYNSFMLSCPKNTIEVYSLSKYFGTTGWRLGLVMMPKDTNLNKMLKQLPANEKQALHKRYSLASIDPEKLTFMDRIVFDSRQVAEAHVGGLSTPQQVLIGLFLFYHMDDSSHKYQRQIQDLLEKRMEVLYSDLKTKPHIVPEATDYYTLLNIPQITENLYGKDARTKLESKYSYLEFMFHLANKYQTVLLPGKGFGTTNNWILRACLANLPVGEYSKISKNLASCIKDFVE